MVLEEARSLQKKRAWNLVIRRSQEVVELSLKAVLRLSGIEVPRVHDVGFLIRKRRDKLPEEFVANLDRITSISRALRQEREVSFYGDEEIGVPGSEIYSKEDARQALQDARWILDLCKAVFEKIDG